MKTLWFIHSAGSVWGPFSSAEVQSRIDSHSFDTNSLVWARGTNEWLPLSEWSTLNKKLDIAAKQAVSKVWYCDSGTGAPVGPLTQEELIQHLQGLNRWDIVTLWGAGQPKWLTLFEMPEVMELVGISRRTHPRAPLLATALLTPNEEAVSPQLLQVKTISVGGFSVKNGGYFNRGDKVQISIRSEQLEKSLHATGEILYVSQRGEAGIRFANLTPGDTKIIEQYIKRFNLEEADAA